jgi:hypothetical protein
MTKIPPAMPDDGKVFLPEVIRATKFQANAFTTQGDPIR